LVLTNSEVVLTWVHTGEVSVSVGIAVSILSVHLNHHQVVGDSDGVLVDAGHLIHNSLLLSGSLLSLKHLLLLSLLRSHVGSKWIVVVHAEGTETCESAGCGGA